MEFILPAYNCSFNLFVTAFMPLKPNAVPAELSFEAALRELEALVARVESGQLPLDELLAGYKRGAELLALCKDKLAAVDQQIKVLDGKNGDKNGDQNGDPSGSLTKP